MPTLGISRVILFAKDMKAMADFYGRVIGLPRIETSDDSEEWQVFDAGGCQLALHQIPEPWAKDVVIPDPPVAREGSIAKVVFFAEDVAAVRQTLVDRGAPMREVGIHGDLQLCDGLDPEGNLFQICNRR